MPAPSERESIRQRYDRDGYVIVRRVLDPELIRETSHHVEWLMREHPDVRPERLADMFVARDPFWIRLVSDARLLDVAQEFIGPNIALFASHYLCKPAGDGLPVLWHQDGSYWPLEPMAVITLWLAVDDSTPENGCMRVVPGTHRLALKELHQRTDVDNVLRGGMDPALVDESKAVDVVLRAGDVSLHHPNIIHGSNANRSPNRRCGLTIRYIPTSTRITKTPWHCDFLLRGRAVPGINDYKPRPKYVPGQHLAFRGCEQWS